MAKKMVFHFTITMIAVLVGLFIYYFQQVPAQAAPSQTMTTSGVTNAVTPSFSAYGASIEDNHDIKTGTAW